MPRPSSHQRSLHRDVRRGPFLMPTITLTDTAHGVDILLQPRCMDIQIQHWLVAVSTTFNFNVASKLSNVDRHSHISTAGYDVCLPNVGMARWLRYVQMLPSTDDGSALAITTLIRSRFPSLALTSSTSCKRRVNGESVFFTIDIFGTNAKTGSGRQHKPRWSSEQCTNWFLATCKTPIPGAVWLFGTVLAGGAGFGRWRKKRKQAA